MWCLLTVAVLLLSIDPTVTEVVQSMSQCPGFLLNEASPNIPDVINSNNIQDQNRYKIICQTFKDTRRFVTLYDTNNKIPVFSASKYRGDDGETIKRSKIWKIEPQLEDETRGQNMEDCNINAVYNNQAGDKDYKEDIRYDRGHLIPASYGLSTNDKDSTCTLTNAVPQVNTFNQGSWARMEICVKCIMDKYCTKNKDIEAYVVTGSKPGKGKKLNDKVNVPSVLWSAFCCYSEGENMWLSGAHWGENVKEDPEPKKYLHMKTLEELSQKFYIDVFPGSNFPRHKMFDRFYPELNNNCQCPPKFLITATISTTAPPTTTNQQQKYLEFLYSNKKLQKICNNILKNRRGKQPKDVRDLCSKLLKHKIRSEDIDSDLKKLVNRILESTG